MAAVTRQSVAKLPEPVRRSLEGSGVVGSEIPRTVTVRQTGRIRTSLSGGWQRFTASEEYTLDPPGFVWRSTLRMGGIPLGRATDSLVDGHGHMHVRLLGMLTVVDEQGPEMDQGSVLRWLNETMWFPAVWTTDLITWEPVDENSARGSVVVGAVTADAEFRFAEDGRLVDFVADRYRDMNGGFELTKWSTPLVEHRRFGGLVLPARGSAVWHLDGEDFEYITISVEDVRST